MAEGLEHPWGMAFLPDGGMLITERPGRLRLLKDGRLQPEAIAGTPEVVARGQGGLLDVALHPDFADNRLVYLSYAGAGEDGVGTEVARARFDGSRLEDLEVIFRAEPKTSGRNHFGSRLLFADDGTLYITLGDRYSFKEEAQNPANHLGSIVRLNDDGSVPDDNPFVGRQDARPEIFSYGHRNVQGLALQRATGTLWAHEHGPQGGDEVNILRPGANYGWPAITYGIDYSGAIISEKTSAPGMEQPVVFWDPSIAPSGMAFYDGDRFPKWKGDLFVGALAHQHLRRLMIEGQRVVGQEVLLEELGERIRDVRVGPDGYLHVLTDSSNGRLLRLEPAGP
ncbi:MAG: PQQ-dependent sugar dehydrogenase [Kiloniellaceae bacterium]|nr:PQQ-dependent sugar dehydrogenase [Kiloniellaceae bacterium]